MYFVELSHDHTTAGSEKSVLRLENSLENRLVLFFFVFTMEKRRYVRSTDLLLLYFRCMCCALELSFWRSKINTDLIRYSLSVCALCLKLYLCSDVIELCARRSRTRKEKAIAVSLVNWSSLLLLLLLFFVGFVSLI